MEYRITYDKIMEVVKEEVSREGNQAYSADGVSLYDAIRLLSRDEAKKKRLMSEVLVTIRTMCNRFIDHADIIEGDPEYEQTGIILDLNMTLRRETGKVESLRTLFRSLTTNLFLNKYFLSKNQTELAAKYDDAAVADVQSLAKLLYEKLPPVYPTIV